MLAEIDDYDWEAAFYYAGGKEANGYKGGGSALPVQVVVNGNCSDEPFDREDVAEIIKMDNGIADEVDWIGLFHLHDGRYAYLEAGCDYTGWD